MKVDVYKDEAGEWRWTATADNGEIVADSGEGYVDLDWAIKAATDLFPAALLEVQEE